MVEYPACHFYFDEDSYDTRRGRMLVTVNTLLEMISRLEYINLIKDTVGTETYVEGHDFTLEQLQLLHEYHPDLFDTHKNLLLKICRRPQGLEFLLSMGATLDNVFQNRFTFNLKLVQLLEWHGISLYGPQELAAFAGVSDSGIERVLEYLISKQVFFDIINWQDPISGDTILHKYCRTHFDDELVLKCINAGFDVRLRNKANKLFYEIPHEKVIKHLLF